MYLSSWKWMISIEQVCAAESIVQILACILGDFNFNTLQHQVEVVGACYRSW